MWLMFRCGMIARRKLLRFKFGGFLDTCQLVGPETLEILNPVMHGFEFLQAKLNTSEVVASRAMREIIFLYGNISSKKLRLHKECSHFDSRSSPPSGCKRLTKNDIDAMRSASDSLVGSQ